MGIYMSEFNLTINRCEFLGGYDDEDETISEAIETIYPYNPGADILLNWNDYLVELSFKDDISSIYNDIVNMIKDLNSIDQGGFEMTWPSSSFFATWHFFIEEDDVRVKAYWTAIKGGGEALKAIREKPNQIIVKKNMFISEWVKLLDIIKEDIEKSGYVLNQLI